MSDHSSLFDSVSGTAINLGRSSYHHTQKVSSLAKEAILQPGNLNFSQLKIKSLLQKILLGLIKDSTMTRPSICANDPSKPLVTEANPNPSIPESTEESISKGLDSFTCLYGFKGSYLCENSTRDCVLGSKDPGPIS